MKSPNAPPRTNPIPPDITVFPGQDSIIICICKRPVSAHILSHHAVPLSFLLTSYQASRHQASGRLAISFLSFRAQIDISPTPPASVGPVVMLHLSPTGKGSERTYAFHCSHRLVILPASWQSAHWYVHGDIDLIRISGMSEVEI
jgi:hypothetical protein